MTRSSPRARKWILRGALAAALAVGVDQLLRFTALSDGFVFGRRIAPYDPPLFTPLQTQVFERLRASFEGDGSVNVGLEFDAELGWAHPPHSGAGEFRYGLLGERIGARELAAVPPDGVRRIAVFGDSFVEGIEVDARECWASRLDELMPEHEVANLGMAGYGLDQAFLRWRRVTSHLAAEEVWLCFMPSALGRVLSLYLPTWNPWTFTPACKPRFVLDPGGEFVLAPVDEFKKRYPGVEPGFVMHGHTAWHDFDAVTLVRSPARSLAELVEILSDCGPYFDRIGVHDSFVRRAPGCWSAFGDRLWHCSAIARLAATAWERGGRAAWPSFKDPSSEAFRVALGIVRRMQTEVEAGGARFRFVVLPDRATLEHATAFETFSGAVAGHGVEVLDLTDFCLFAKALERPDWWASGQHYTALGNDAIAVELARRLAH